MNDQLARLARNTVKLASRARLTIHGCSLGPGSTVTGLHADNGWPVFWCALGSTVAVAAEENRRAVLTVSGPEDAREVVTVLLAGQLEIIGRSWAHGRQIGAVALVLAEVIVETQSAGRPGVSRVVPVDDYTGLGLGGLSEFAVQIARHTNAAHGDLLRCLAAARAGVPAAQVAAAWLTGLNECGAQLAWVDTAGAHAMRVSFPRQARTAAELAMLLREQLAAGCQGKEQ